MAARTRFALVFWMAVAVEVAIPTIKPWASTPECQSKSAEPIAAWEIIYRPGDPYHGRWRAHVPRFVAGKPPH